MNQFFPTQLNTGKDCGKKKIVLPKKDDVPVGASERLAREEIRKLTQNAEEIRKLREQAEQKETRPDEESGS